MTIFTLFQVFYIFTISMVMANPISASAQSIYKCKGSKGEIVFSDTACGKSKDAQLLYKENKAQYEQKRHYEAQRYVDYLIKYNRIEEAKQYASSHGVDRYYAIQMDQYNMKLKEKRRAEEAFRQAQIEAQIAQEEERKAQIEEQKLQAMQEIIDRQDQALLNQQNQLAQTQILQSQINSIKSQQRFDDWNNKWKEDNKHRDVLNKLSNIQSDVDRLKFGN